MDNLVFFCRICLYILEIIVPSMIASHPGLETEKQVQLMKMPPL